MPFGAGLVNDQDSRRPLSAEALAEPLKLILLLADVDAHRKEVVGDEIGDVGVRVHLGLQPSTAASPRRGGEIEQYRVVQVPRAFELAVEVVRPADFVLFSCGSHTSPPCNARARDRIRRSSFDKLRTAVPQLTLARVRGRILLSLSRLRYVARGSPP